MTARLFDDNGKRSHVWAVAKRICVLGSIASFGLLLVSCSGDTGNSEAPTANENEYSGDPQSTGVIEIDPKTDTLSVSETTSYFVRVRKGDESPVKNIRVACDTERGLSLIEPSTGIEATDSFGNMSGVLGCAAPGSFQIGCRLPIGANKRTFRTIKCTGDIPEGFTGFPGAGGGGLYGGVAVPPNGNPGGTGTDGIEITSVYFEDGGQNPTDSIDTGFNPDCNEDAVLDDPETFTDTYVEFKLINEGNQSVRLTGYRYTVPNAGSGTHRSSIIPLAGGSSGTLELAGNGAETKVRGLFAIASGGRSLIGPGTPTIGSVGFRNVGFEVFGSTESGDDFELDIHAGASFGNFNRCGS